MRIQTGIPLNKALIFANRALSMFFNVSLETIQIQLHIDSCLKVRWLFGKENEIIYHPLAPFETFKNGLVSMNVV